MEVNMNKITQRIKNRRLELDYSFQDLAEKTNMSKSTLQRYETGAIKNVPLDKLEILANALQVSPAYLMGWETNIFCSNNISDKTYDKNTQLAINYFVNLNEIDQAQVLGYMKALLDKEI